MSDPDLLRPPPDEGWRDHLATARERLDAAPRWKLGAAGVLIGLAVLAAAVLARPAGRPAEDGIPFAGGTAVDGTATTAGSSTTTTKGALVVHVAGAVAHPGVYSVRPGARVVDALDAAGGPTPEADPDRINLAAPLSDGERVYVPKVGEAAPAVPTGGGHAEGATAPVDLNTATAAELDALPGVGPATAAAIIDHREQHGPFTSIDQLLDVRGIGPAKLEQIRPLVTV